MKVLATEGDLRVIAADHLQWAIQRRPRFEELPENQRPPRPAVPDEENWKTMQYFRERDALTQRLRQLDAPESLVSTAMELPDMFPDPQYVEQDDRAAPGRHSGAGR
jgi:hypothetical protein